MIDNYIPLLLLYGSFGLVYMCVAVSHKTNGRKPATVQREMSENQTKEKKTTTTKKP